METTPQPRTKEDLKTPPTRTPTITLFVPQIIWFQDLLNRKVQTSPVSLSTFLLSLVIADLKRRRRISAAELELWDQRKDKQSREGKRGVHTKFTLYVPPALNFLKQKIKQVTPTQSTYVWSLFILSHEGQLTRAQIKEWHQYCTVPQRGSVSRERKAKILQKKVPKA